MKKLLIIVFLYALLMACAKSSGPTFEPYYRGPIYVEVDHHESF